MAPASSVTSRTVKSETLPVLMRYIPCAPFSWLLFSPLMEYIREHLTSCWSRLNPWNTVSCHWSRAWRMIQRICPSTIILCTTWNLSGGLDPLPSQGQVNTITHRSPGCPTPERTLKSFSHFNKFSKKKKFQQGFHSLPISFLTHAKQLEKVRVALIRC